MAALADHHQDAGLGGSGAVRGLPASDPSNVGTRTGASETGPITGPMPVLDLADGHLHVSMRRDVTVVSIDGGLDIALADQLAPLVHDATEAADAVVLDLDQATILEQDAVLALCRSLPAEVPRCIVAGRLSGRLMLERWGVDEDFVVFMSVADALQARSFLHSGYGTGWMTRTEVAARR